MIVRIWHDEIETFINNILNFYFYDIQTLKQLNFEENNQKHQKIALLSLMECKSIIGIQNS